MAEAKTPEQELREVAENLAARWGCQHGGNPFYDRPSFPKDLTKCPCYDAAPEDGPDGEWWKKGFKFGCCIHRLEHEYDDGDRVFSRGPECPGLIVDFFLKELQNSANAVENGG